MPHFYPRLVERHHQEGQAPGALAASPVRVTTKIQSEICARLVQIFWPLTTHCRHRGGLAWTEARSNPRSARKTLAEDGPARRDVGREAGLLLLGAEGQGWSAGQFDADVVDAARHPGAGIFLGKDHLLGRGWRRARPILTGQPMQPQRAPPSACSHSFAPLGRLAVSLQMPLMSRKGRAIWHSASRRIRRGTLLPAR